MALERKEGSRCNQCEGEGIRACFGLSIWDVLDELGTDSKEWCKDVHKQNEINRFDWITCEC